jgi:hypothetical protein
MTTTLRSFLAASLALALTVSAAPHSAGAAPQWLSHPPTRPLPVASNRPRAEGPVRFVDAKNGADENPGTESAPWKTLAFAAGQLRPGHTLYLRGGVYFEHVPITVSGEEGKPITIRSYPGELAILDGGLPEFQTAPQSAWTPCPGGADGEFRSAKAYPELGGQADGTNVLGNFGDSLVPLHGYRFLGDLRSDNPYWNVSNKVGDEEFVYCGPGVFYDVETGYIHARLAPTRLPGLGEDNFRGETDPRELPLVIAGHAGGPVLTLAGVRHLRLQDLVLRGARDATLDIHQCRNVELDGLTIYGGSAPVRVRDTVGLRMQHTACRGLAAPWTFRGSLKYRAIESRLLSASGWAPTGADSRNFEIAWCEFTDSVDGVFVGNVAHVDFHHNLLDNVSDDGIFLTATTGYDGATHGGEIRIHENLLSRCLTTFAFGVGHGRQKTIAAGKQTGAGVFIYRNVFDFRRPVMYHWPTGPEAPQEITSVGRVASDHGGPAWEPMWIYHNTILAGGPPRYDYGTDGLGKAMNHGTKRRVFNNIICQMAGMVGQSLPTPGVDFQGDGNLFWSLTDGPSFAGPLFAKFRNSPDFLQTQKSYAPGWTAHDLFADPGFAQLDSDWRMAPDLRLSERSPAVDAGTRLPEEWPDPLRPRDEGAPDIGAVPRSVEPWRIGVQGRLTVFGGSAPAGDIPFVENWAYPPAPAESQPSAGRALIVQGYPAFDAPLIEYALRRRGERVDVVERTWVSPSEFHRYGAVFIDGSFIRAGIEPNKFSEADLAELRRYVEEGGALVLMRERTDLFAPPHGREFLHEVFGEGNRDAKFAPALKPNHPWVKHLAENASNLELKALAPLRTGRGETILGKDGISALHRAPLGKGEIIYVGWSIAGSLPPGRQPSTLADEANFEAQMHVLSEVAADAISPP